MHVDVEQVKFGELERVWIQGRAMLHVAFVFEEFSIVLVVAAELTESLSAKADVRLRVISLHGFMVFSDHYLIRC